MPSPDMAFVILAAAVGLVIGSAFTRAKLRSALIAADRNLESRLRIFEVQLRENFRCEREKWVQAKIEDAYSELGGWLWELDLAIDGMVANLYSDDENLTEETLSEIKGWHWYRLRPPRSVAATQHYWSSEVHEKVNKIYENSQPFVGEVKEAISDPGAQSGREEDLLTPRQKVWERRFELQAAISRIRKQMHSEVFDMKNRED